MGTDESKQEKQILHNDALNMVRPHDDVNLVRGVTRRDFIKYTGGAIACASISPLVFGCGGRSGSLVQLRYPIDSTVVKTTERMISFPYTPASPPPTPGIMPNPANPPASPNGRAALTWDKLSAVSEYDNLGYGTWEFGAKLPIMPRTDIMADPDGYLAKVNAGQVVPTNRLLNFVAMTDVHLTDKEAPNQFIALQQGDPGYSGQNTSIYSPIMPYTPHVFDAAIQTANALHRKNPFDFFICLGDVCNSSSYNELRWYLDIIDGKVITPSSGAHLGKETIDYQKPFKAAGLDKSLPFYQALGNHDHFMIGSFPVYENGLENTYTSDYVWSVPYFLEPDSSSFPAMFSVNKLKNDTPRYYGGIIDGTTALGHTIDTEAAGVGTPPKVAADPNRRSLHRTEWIQEFFKTTTHPSGHGFNLVDPSMPAGFACYSFLPKSDVPLKVIVLDDTQREDDGSVDIHGHGFLDPTRWAWLQNELTAGQDANQLMIIASHIPICVSNIADETEWWLGGSKGDPSKLGDPSTTTQNAVDITRLVNTLWETPNLLMWIAGHRHVNAVKAFKSPTPLTSPEQGFWQVESSSLHDYPQQFRTFEVYLNSDYTISIETVNVDPAVAPGTPATTSRKNAIAAQQIVQNDLTGNSKNYAVQPSTGTPGLSIPTMDPSRDQDGNLDPSIQYVDLSKQGVPFNMSYNARLFKQLSPAMTAQMQLLYPTL